MRKLVSACTLTLALSLGWTVSARAVEPSTPAPDPAKAQPQKAAVTAPAKAQEPAAPATQTATPAPTAPALTLPGMPGTDGAQIGTPAPLAMTCPGIAYCEDFCRSNGQNCVAVYHCYINGTWSCQCYGPGGLPCD